MKNTFLSVLIILLQIVRNNHKISSFFLKTSNKVTPERPENDDVDVIPATPTPVLTKQSRILDTISCKDDSNKRKVINPIDNNIRHNCDESPPRKKKFGGERKNLDYNIPSTSKSICSSICNTSIIKSVTPEKRFNKQSPNSPGKKTPNRSKGPGKVLCKSPPATDFNVEIVKNFTKITPSKSSTEFGKDETPRKSSMKKQSSILKYISPSPKYVLS